MKFLKVKAHENCQMLAVVDEPIIFSLPPHLRASMMYKQQTI